MKNLLLAVASLCALSGAAEAKCSTAALDGVWVYFSDSKFGTTTYLTTIKNGKFFTQSTGYDFSVTMSSSCRGNVAVKQGNSPIYYGKAASEHISEASPLKPNLLEVNFMFDANNGYAVKLFRKTQG